MSAIKSVTLRPDNSDNRMDIAMPESGRGSITVIAGPNGVGKSFIMRDIHALLSHNAGNDVILASDRTTVELSQKGKLSVVQLGDVWREKNYAGEVSLDNARQPQANYADTKSATLSFARDQIVNETEKIIDAQLWKTNNEYRLGQISSLAVEDVVYRCDNKTPLVERMEKLLVGQLYFRIVSNKGKDKKKVIGVGKSRGKGDSFQLVLLQRDEVQIPYPFWSDGQKALFFTTLVLDYFKPEIVLFDEIENHLHPAYMSAIFGELRSAVKQAIVTTHHPHVIFSEHIAQVYFIEHRDGIEKKSQKARFTPYIKPEKGRCYSRRVVRIENDFERLANTYNLFNSADSALLKAGKISRQAIEARFFSELLEALSGLVKEKETSGNVLPDSQTRMLLNYLSGIEKKSDYRVLDYGSGFGRTEIEVSKIPAERIGASVEWHCWEPDGNRRSGLSKRMKGRRDVVVIEREEDIGTQEYNIGLLVNVLHELNPEEFQSVIAAVSSSVINGGTVLILDMYPLLKPEGLAVPYSCTDLQDILSSIGLSTSANVMAIRQMVTGYYIAYSVDTDKRYEELSKVVEKKWEEMAKRATGVYASSIGREKSILENQIFEAQAVLTIASISAAKYGMWRRKYAK